MQRWPGWWQPMATTAFTSRRKFSRKGGDIAAALSRLAEARRQ